VDFYYDRITENRGEKSARTVSGSKTFNGVQFWSATQIMWQTSTDLLPLFARYPPAQVTGEYIDLQLTLLGQLLSAIFHRKTQYL
jgi:hypothetical protein